MTHLELSSLTDEQRLKITQGIVDDLVRALNLGNYALIWRYFSDDLAQKLNIESFAELHQHTTQQFQQLDEANLLQSKLSDDRLRQEWRITTESDQDAVMTLTLIPVKEFLAIDSLHIK